MTTQPRRRRIWVWFFVLLGILTVAGVIIPLIAVPLVHGLVPVTRENLQAARQLWEQKGPRDYDMEYQKQGAVKDSFNVQVRNGKAVSVVMNNEPLDPNKDPRLFEYQTMTAMFDDLERFVELASKPDSPQTMLRARFDPVDGHIIRYIYSVTGTPQQIQISVRLQRVESGK
jgi:Family of unknown function (DUF6174)